MCVVETAQEMEASFSPYSLEELRQVSLSLAQFPLCSNQELDQVLPCPCQPSDFSDPLPLPGFQESRPGSGSAGEQPPTCSSGILGRSFLMQLAAQALDWEICCCLWSQAVSKMSLLREKPSFLPGINKAAYGSAP